MLIETEDDFSEIAVNHPWSEHFSVLLYRQGGHSVIPHLFFRDWLDMDAQQQDGKFFIGRCSGFGVGSIAKYDSNQQSLRVGRFVSGGLRLKFLLNGQHESRTISTYMFGITNSGIQHARPPQYSDSIIRNDVWIGDEAMMLGGGIIENGCIIGARALLPPNFRSEPFGIYAGTPARLIRFRFSDRIRETLSELAWWEMPLQWIKENNQAFLSDLTGDEGRILEMLRELILKKRNYLTQP